MILKAKSYFMKILFFIFLSGFILLSNFCFSQTKKTYYTSNEQSYSKLFIGLINLLKEKRSDKTIFIIDSTGESRDTEMKNDSLRLNQKESDTTDIKYILANYIFAIDITKSLSEAEKFKIEDEEISDLYVFLHSKTLDNLQIKPLRLDDHDYNKHIYNTLSDFQKENTFILFNKNSPEKLLGYILFIPGNKIKSSTPRILSWKLTYCFGHYYFTDIFRREGTEILWEGAKGTEHLIEAKSN